MSSIDLDLTETINTYRGPLIGLIASWGAPWVDAIEIAQDSFSEAWLKRESCRGDWQNPDVFGGWMRGVAHNTFRNWRRGRSRRRLRIATDPSVALDQVAERGDSESAENLETLRAAIDRLPARQRQVVMMHYLEETKIKRVAALLSVSEKTIEGRLYQARRALRRMLDQQPPTSPIAKVFLCLCF
jgi:RNA polymerase sigma factor (sigma-70 family)